MPEFPTITHVALTVSDLSDQRAVVRAALRAPNPCSTRTPGRSGMWCGCSGARRSSGSTSSPTWPTPHPSTNADWGWTIWPSPVPTRVSSSSGRAG